MAIVLIGDEESEAEIIGDSIARSFSQVHMCKSIYQAAELVEVHHADLIIFFLNSIESAENKLQSLYGVSQSLAQREVKLLLLCKGAESRMALQLCEDGIFDDFLIAQPLQDATQLHWVVERLMNQKVGSISSQFKVIQSLEKELEALKKSFSEINNLPVAVRKQIVSIETTLDELSDINSIETTDNSSFDSFQQKIKAIRQQNLTPSLSKLSAEVESFTDYLSSECLQHFKSIHHTLSKDKLQLEAGSSPKILVADDNEGFRHIVHEVLEYEGYNVIAVSSAKKAISLILRERPALVLVDYDMPEINGIQMIHDISQLLPSHLLPPFVMVTGYSLKNIVEESAHLGVVDFIVKPIRRKTILEKVQKHVRQQGVSL